MSLSCARGRLRALAGAAPASEPAAALPAATSARRVSIAAPLLALLATACGGGGSASGGSSPNVQPTAAPPRPAVELAAPAQVEHGRPATLRWTVSNATTCTASDGWSGSKAHGGGSEDSPVLTRDTTFTLTCSGTGGETVARAAVAVLPSVDVTATPNPVVHGSAVRVTWMLNAATACIRTGGWSGSAELRGEAELRDVNADVTVGVRCSNAAGSREASVTVAVTYPAPVVSVAATPRATDSGDAVTVQWSAANATSCSASGLWSGAKGTSGSERHTPSTSGDFELSCLGRGGQARASARVTVNPPVQSVSGAVLLPATMQTDTDVNDVNAARTGNDSPTQAQPLPAPVVLGGYVAVSGTGPSGALGSAGGPDDYYRVALARGQVLELTLAADDLQANDVDLLLLNPDGLSIDESIGTGRVERLTVPVTGHYVVRVNAWRGASKYTLVIGDTPSPAASGPTLSQEFVPGEVIVGLKPASTAMGAVDARAGALSTRHGLVLLDGAAGRPLRYQLGHGRARVQTADATVAGTPTHRLRQAKRDTLYALKELSRDPSVAYAEPNYVFRPASIAAPNDPLYARQRWHYEQIRLPQAWTITTGDTHTVVAVVDSGVRPHLDLAARAFEGYDFVDGPNTGDGDGPDADPTDPGHPNSVGRGFHGTHVAGTIGAIGNNGTGVTGVAWNVSLMNLRVLDAEGAGSSFAIYNAIRYAAGLPNQSNRTPSRRAAVINLSLGAQGPCPSGLQQVIDEARAQGVIVVAAAGNAAADLPFSPANCRGVVSVAALQADRRRAGYSNFGQGPGVDVAAPGGNLGGDQSGDGHPDGVFSTWAVVQDGEHRSDYHALQGTSMAAPHVTGVVALMKSLAPNMTPAQFDRLLAAGLLTDDVGAPGADELGIGLINAQKAVEAVRDGSVTIPARLGANPGVLSFGQPLSAIDVTLSNLGDAALTVGGVTTSARWITVRAVEPGTGGLGTYRVSVARSELPDGEFSGWVEFASSTGVPLRINLSGEKSSRVFEPDGAVHYVQLLNAETQAVVRTERVAARGSRVAFRFRDVADGRYLVVAGTDLDNDGRIRERGEAYGAFGGATPSTITLQGASRSGVEFATEYRTQPP